MEYLLKASGLVIIFISFYYLFLRNETFFKSIRIYFLIGLITIVSIPLIQIPIYIEAASKQISNLNFIEINATQIIEKTTDWLQIATIIYLIGVVIFSLKFLIQLGSLAFLLSKHEHIKKGNYYFVETTKNISPFSFFNLIIYNKSHFSIPELEQVIYHEKAHVKQWHSLDTILTHLLVITLWFNPFVWIFKNVVQQNLEFLADSYVNKKSNNTKLYQFTLLKTCNTNYCTDLTNNFYNSLIKKRIIMLHKNQSENKKQWTYTLLIPIIIAFIAVFNTKTIAQEKMEWVAKTETVEIIIDKNTSDAALTQESAHFKNEFNITLSFKGLKRNIENEITAIKIEAKGSNLKASFENTGTTAIKPIKISYDKQNNSVSIGNLSENNYNYTIDNDADISFQGTGDHKENYIFITSEGDVNTWTSKSDSIVSTEKIMIDKNGNKEVIWVEKKNGSENGNVQVIEFNSEGDKNKKIIITEGNNTFNIEEDNASEKVYIITKDNGDIEKKVIKTKIVSTGSDNKPFIIVDGKEISSEEMDKINPDDIASINVLKGESATKKYGEKGKNGVIEIIKKQ